MAEHSFKSGDQIGHYRLAEKIGSGGQGEVWLARDERFDRHVALKILPAHALADADARDRFRREARAVGKLNHPNIATAHDFDTKPVDYLVTEYVPGSGLDQRLAGGALPEETVLALGIQLVSGLEAAHREGIIHRDLKPGNLRITENGTLKILDFGLAEMFDPTKDLASIETITINMTLTGTVPYMAPEQFSGIADQRTDLWSVGAVLYEMATGKLPFTETQILELRNAIQRNEPARPSAVNPAVSAGIEQVILRCLKKNPSQRYQSATELREDLVRLSEGRKTKGAEKHQGKRFAVAALVVVLVASAFTGVYYWPQIKAKLWPQQTAQFRLLAILPMDTAGQSPSENALIRGIADTISTRIAKGTYGQKVQLIGPSELIARDARTTDAARREFGVDQVLEVTMQRSGDKVRVTCSLIDSKTHQVLNACTVTGDGSDLFALEDKLAGDVVAMLPQGSHNEQGAPEVVHAANPDGYEAYLKGKGYLLDYQKPENIDAAIGEFEQALKVSPKFGPAMAGLGEAYWRKYRDDRNKKWIDLAISNCQNAVSADPNSAGPYTCLGLVQYEQGQYENAVTQMKHALELDNRDADAYRGLGNAYDQLGKFAEAEQTYKKAIEMFPQYWAVYNWLGTFYASQANYKEAATMFSKVTKLAPENYRGFSNLGGVLVLEGKYDEAIAAANQSIRLSPNLDAYCNLGAAYFWQHRYADAVPAFEKARELQNRDVLNWGNLGDALYWTPGRRAEASPAYKRAIELAQSQLQVNPKDAASRAYIAEYGAMLGDKELSVEQIQEALKLSPSDPEIAYRASLVYNQLGDHQKTMEWLKKAVAGGYSLTVVRDTPDFAQLQSDPAFKALVVAK